jgi:hypothetical protein
MSAEENGKKSRNGSSLEQRFINETGYPKALKKDKAIYTNSNGKEQVIDADFIIKQSGITYYIDLTTTWRLARAKQKAYNGILLKTKNTKTKKYEFIIGVGSFIENGKVIADPKLLKGTLEGIDHILSVEDVIKMFKKKKVENFNSILSRIENTEFI